MSTPPTEFSIDLIDRCARAALAYRFKRWGFAEEMALLGLIEIGDALDRPEYVEAVAELVAGWVSQEPRLTWADHVAPGTVMLELFKRGGDERYRSTARALGELYLRFPRVSGVPLHRPDLDGWEHTIWVDCMMIDGPFLLRLAHLTGEQRWRDLALEHLDGYHACLFDPDVRLYAHGFDAHKKRRSAVRWGRGNGWALLGMVEAAGELLKGQGDPRETTPFKVISERVATLVEAIVPLQDASGAWHTVLDDATTPLEGSTSALFATAMMRARQQGIIGEIDGLDRCVGAALADVARRLQPDGRFLVSAATPIGERDHYASQPLGVYPWGQGPALLAIREALRPALTPIVEEDL